MPIKKHDFVELEFTGRFKDSQVFDTTDKKIAEQNNILNPQLEYRPAIVAVGEQQVPAGLDQDLEGKELNKEYTVELKPEQAFGKKNAKLIKLIPSSAFKKQEIMPQPGLQVNIDNELGTILRVSGGRILVDFNHPFASKEVVYTYKINRILTNTQEKIESFLKMAFNMPGIKVEVKDNKAEITLPIELPEPAQKPIKEKLIELTQVKEIIFKKQEPKKPLNEKPLNESEKDLENQKDSQKQEKKTETSKKQETKPEENKTTSQD